MDGFDVDAEGNLTHNGETIRKAKFNGATYFGGNVKNAIDELPAEIIERIQVIDDYGEQARFTGLKANSQKVLNVVSKPDRSVGLLSNLETKGGTRDQLKAGAGLKRIDGLDQKGVGIVYAQKPLGITEQGITPVVSSGMDKNKDLNLVWNKSFNKVDVENTYSFSDRVVHSFKNVSGSEFYDDNSVISKSEIETDVKDKKHQLNSKINYHLDKNQDFIFGALLTHQHSSVANDRNTAYDGLQRQVQSLNDYHRTSKPSFNINGLYRLKLNDAGANLAITAQIGRELMDRDRDQQNKVVFYEDATGGGINPARYRFGFFTARQQYQLSVVLGYPLSHRESLILQASSNYNSTKNHSSAKVEDSENSWRYIDSLGQQFEYKNIQYPVLVSYRYKYKEYEVAIGAKTIFTGLKTLNALSGSNSDKIFSRISPDVHLRYTGSNNLQFSLKYIGEITAPTFETVQPLQDISNPLYQRFGNTELKPVFAQKIDLKYNQYFNSSGVYLMLAIGVGLAEKIVENQFLKIEDNVYIRETRYINSRNNRSFQSNYSIGKRFSGSGYNLNLVGMFQYQDNKIANNFIFSKNNFYSLYQNINLAFTLKKCMETKISVIYLYNRMSYVASDHNFFEQRWHAVVDGKAYLDNTFNLIYELSQQIVSGLPSNTVRNPFVVNLMAEKRFLKAKNATFSLGVSDLFKASNFVNRIAAVNGITEIKTNANSRLFMLKFQWAPQKWSGSKSKSGVRNSDGSFKP
ncbi:outer membrane beta-barrel protein [Pedobacter africanus]|nr:outer membrane beta-barrel protein [Pedobacter africanus]